MTLRRSSPEYDAGRRTASQPTSGRRKVRREMFDRIVVSGMTASTPRSARSGGVFSTTRADPPVSRPLTYWPSTASVRETVIAAGSVTRTSVSSVRVGTA